MTPFEEAIKKYLDQVASEDAAFKEKYESEDKSLTKCCDYIVSEVKRIGRKGYTDGEIYQMARHYYNEPNEELKIDSSQKNCKIVTNEESQDTFEKAPTPKAKPVTNSKPKPAKKEEKQLQQLSLFDFGMEI